ncbi:MAG: ComEC/Rec2 family competence protein [Almyronema sp.]
MTPITGLVICLAYVVGLLASGFSVVPEFTNFLGLPLGGYGLALASGGCAALLPRRWYRGPSVRGWLIAGLVGLLAAGYCSYRTPQPTRTDISQLVSAGEPSTLVVRGAIVQEPRLTRSDKGQLWVNVYSVRESGGTQAQKLNGKLYVTAPKLQITGLRAGQQVLMMGHLYAPQAAQNPNGFDFQKYLASKGCFAGFLAAQLEPASQPGLGLWQIRQRIVQAQARSLGSPAGPLMSAMALGRKAVDLPFDVRDAFIQAGLAHTLAASGFHVSLVLGLILSLVRSRSSRTQVISGAIALVSYVGLTGAQPSVMRAALMGGGALIGLATERKVSSLGCLVVAATGLLLWQPTWIWDIGFQLSVAATFGLIVTAQPLSRWLDWLPSPLASAIAVPIAASLWTAPLQLYHFNTLPTYGILLNLLATPLVSLISLGGIATGLLALIWQPAGSAIAGLLYYPIHLLIVLVEFCNQQPGSSMAIAQVSLWQVLGLYSLFGLGWLQPWLKQRQWLVGAIACGLVIVPAWSAAHALQQITVLSTPQQSALVVQRARQTVLISDGDSQTAGYTVLPFLQQAGVNRLSTGILLGNSGESVEGWTRILQQTPAQVFYTATEVSTKPLASQLLPIGKTTDLDAAQIQNLGANSPILRILFADQAWLSIGQLSSAAQQQLASVGDGLKSQVIWWTGDTLAENLLDVVDPAVAIYSGYQLDEAVEAKLRDRQVTVYWTQRDGAIQWRSDTGFQTTLAASQDAIALE